MLRLDESGIHLAAYLTELPPIELLREKLHQAVADAQKLIENRPSEVSECWR